MAEPIRRASADADILPFRLDRLVTLGLAAPWRRLRGRTPSGARLCILMYHGICDAPDTHLHPYWRTVTTPQRFREQMALLAADGYRTMTLTDGLRQAQADAAIEARGGGVPQGRPIVVVTFDDGLRDFHTQAFGVMDALHIPATVFLTSGCLDGRFVTGPECLHRRDVAELAALGVEFGSHTVSHPRLVDLAAADIERELGASRRQIEDIVGRPVETFSYPYRFPQEDEVFTARLRRLLTAAGYRAGVTTRIGCASLSDEPLFHRRLPINDADDPALFKAKLDGDYDWLHGVQTAWKQARRTLRRQRPPLARGATA